MNNFDNELREELINYLKAPDDFDAKVYEALELAQNMKRENRKDNKKGTISVGLTRLRYAVVTVFATILTCLTGFTVYASVGGTINGIPAFEWVSIRFGGNIENYKTEIADQVAKYEDTSVSLVSSTSLEYATVLEFDVKLSDEDKEFLRLGESVLTQKDYDDIEENFKNIEDISQIDENFDSRNIMNKEKALEKIKKYDKYINTLSIGFYKEKTMNEDYWVGEVKDDGNPRHDFNMWALPSTKDYVRVDGQKVNARCFQNVEKLTDNEYKIYVMFLITDEDLNNKNNYNIELNNISLANKPQLKAGEVLDIDNYENYLYNTTNNTRILHIDGEISASIDKTKILADSKIITNIEQTSQYQNVTDKVEEVIVTPVHTIVKTKTTLTNFTNIRKDDSGIDDLQNPQWMNYNIADKNGNIIENTSFITSKTVTLSNGTKEEWDPQSVDSEVENATMEYTTYIIFDTQDTNQISVEPNFEAHTPLRASDKNYKEYNQTMPKIIVDLEK